MDVRESGAYTQVHIARQPICQPDRTVHGYELLFRAGADADRSDVDDERATSSVIVTSMLDLDPALLGGEHLTFLNITREFAVGDLPLPFSADGVVLELIENVPVDAPLYRGMEALADRGFALALDDFEWSQHRMPLLPLVDYVKVDITGKSREELSTFVRRLRKHDVLTVAERVETEEQLEDCLAAEFDLVQGHHLLRPVTLTARVMTPDRLARLELIGLLCRPDVAMRDVEAIVSRDAGLAHRVLKAVRSASVGVGRPVESLNSALVLLGLDRLRAWVTLLGISGDHPSQALAASFAVSRGRFCQLLAQAGSGTNPSEAFLAGMLSGLSHVLDVPRLDLVSEISLAPAIKSALLTGAGPLGAILLAAESFERVPVASDSSPVPPVESPVPAADMARAYLSALLWTDQLSAAGAVRGGAAS